MSHPISPPAAERSRRIAWIAVAIAVVVLGMNVVRVAMRGSVGWTSWALPILILTNIVPLALGLHVTRPRLARALTIVSLVLALAVIFSEIALLARAPR